MRTFVAVFPSPEAQQAAAGVIEALRSPNDGVSWVRPDNLHYTLRFIGEVGDDGARRVGEAAQAAVHGRAAFDAVLGAAGAFPNLRRPRALWLGLSEGEAALVAVAGRLEDELVKRGFDREGKKFTAHLTIGRVRDAREDWTARLAAAALPVPTRFRVDRLCVVVSQLSTKGSIYKVWEEASFEVQAPR